MAKKKNAAKAAEWHGTVTGLIDLAAHITALLDQGQLDPRFVEKLARKFRQELSEVETFDAKSPESLALQLALDGLDIAVKRGKVDGLMEAMARMREADASETQHEALRHRAARGND